MLYMWDIEKIIEKTLHEHNLNINTEFDNNITAPMIYYISTNTIKFNYLKVNGYVAKINFKIKETDEDCVKIMIYHVLGYYINFEKNPYNISTLMYGDEKEKQPLLSKIDTNAWEYGRTLIPEQLLNSYDKVRELDKDFNGF